MVVVVLVLAASSGCAGRPGAAAAAGGSWDASVVVLQMNLCGSGSAACYTGRSVAEAGRVIRAEVPDVVTLNEVCRDDVAALGEQLDDVAGGDVVVSAFRAVGDRRTGAPIRCRTGLSYGIGVVARLPPASAGYDASDGTYPVQDRANAEERAWLCLRPGVAAEGPVSVCTTHLADTLGSVAGAQCGHLLDTVIPALRSGAGPSPLVLGGDLNLTSGGAPDVGHCVAAGDRRADDGLVQYVATTDELVIGSHRTIGMRETDHPGLLVTLHRRPHTDSRAHPAGGRQ